MRFITTIKEFHWLTKTVIALLASLIALTLIAIFVNVNLIWFVFYYSEILKYIFLIIFVIIVLCIFIGRVQEWFEHYMDALLGKLDKITVSDDVREKITALDYKLEGIEKKVDKMEKILEDVSN